MGLYDIGQEKQPAYLKSQFWGALAPIVKGLVAYSHWIFGTALSQRPGSFLLVVGWFSGFL